MENLNEQSPVVNKLQHKSPILLVDQSIDRQNTSFEKYKLTFTDSQRKLLSPANSKANERRSFIQNSDQSVNEQMKRLSQNYSNAQTKILELEEYLKSEQNQIEELQAYNDSLKNMLKKKFPEALIQTFLVSEKDESEKEGDSPFKRWVSFIKMNEFEEFQNGEKNMLIRNIEELSDRLCILESEKKELLEFNFKVNTEIEGMVKEVKKLKGEKEQLETDKEALLEFADEMENSDIKAKEFIDKCRSQEKEINLLKEELKKVNEFNISQEKLKKDFESKIKEQQEEIQILRLKQGNDKQNCVEEIKQLYETLSVTRNHNRSLKSNLDSLTFEKETLNSDFELQKNRNCILEKKLEEKVSQLHYEQSKVSKLSSELEEVRDRDITSSQLEEIYKEVRELDFKVNSIEIEKNGIQNLLNQNKNFVFSADGKALLSEYEQIITEIVKNECEVFRVTKEKENLEIIFEEKCEKSMQKSIERTKEFLSELKMNSQILKSKKEIIEKELEGMKISEEGRFNSVFEIEKKFYKLQNEMSSLKSELELKENTIETVRNAYQELKQSFAILFNKKPSAIFTHPHQISSL